jgi:ABC-type lipoprotein release transport system permease subunit
VWRIVVSQLRHRRARALALVAGILVATTSFTVLTGTSTSQRLQVTGTVSATFRSAYDVLVRPRGSGTRMERRAGVVRPNYLSGAFGGITVTQWRRIERVPGVAVAAPIANVGYVLPEVTIPVPVPRRLLGRGRSLLRARITWISDRGLTRARDASAYLYVTPRSLEPQPGGRPASSDTDERIYARYSPREVERGGRRVPVCPDEAAVTTEGDGPFDPRYRTSLDCFSLRTGLRGAGWAPFRRGQVGVQLRWTFPVLLAAVDPEQEARLTGLRQAVVGGRYLHEGDGPRVVGRRCGGVFRGRRLPVLAASRTLVDEHAELSIAPLPARAANAMRRRWVPNPLENPLLRFLDAQRSGPVLHRVIIDPERPYRDLLASFSGDGCGPAQTVDQYWTVGPTRYRARGGGLAPRVVPPPAPETFFSASQLGSYVRAPASGRDLQFRAVLGHQGDASSISAGDVFDLPALQRVGTFDPDRLRSFDPRTALPLETYLPPALPGADAPSRRRLGDRPLAPNGNLGGYLAQPPLLLTTISAARVFAPPLYQAGRGRAPISAVRVRVAGVTGPDPLSRERIRLVAQRIAQRTGLDVDVTVGSSPAPTRVELPAGRLGRPALALAEPWVKKNVATALLATVDRKSLVLFGLILVVCALFVANAASAAVRSRRSELGVLACLGWSRSRLFAVVLGELGLIGIVAGMLGAAISMPLAAVLGVDASPVRAALAIPAAVVLALLAGAVPALRASRARPLAAVRPPVLEAGRSWRCRSLTRAATINLLRAPGRTALAVASLAIGICALTLLLAVSVAFHNGAVGTLLGDAVALQVRGGDVVAAVTMLLLGASAVADVLFLNLHDRAGEMAVLTATGWTDRDLGRLVVLEGIGIGVLGGLLGAAAGLAGAALFTAAVPGELVAICAATALAGALLAALAALAPARRLGRLPLVALLASE